MVCRQVETQALATCTKSLLLILPPYSQSPREMRIRLRMLIQDGIKWLKSLGSSINT